MTPKRLWVNGELIDATSSVVSAHDHGFQLGDGVFDTLILRNRTPLFLERHLRRLRAGCDLLQISHIPTNAEIAEAVTQLVEANNLDDARLRITVTPGPGPSPRDRGEQPLTVITMTALGSVPESVSLCSVPWIRNERSPVAGIKSTSWGENAAILRFAHANGFDNAVLCDSVGRLSECTTSNLFLVINDSIVTPRLESGCLPGIIRDVLIEGGLATELDLLPSDFDRATEVFITSSTTGIVPVRRVDDRDFPTDGVKTTQARSALERAEGTNATS